MASSDKRPNNQIVVVVSECKKIQEATGKPVSLYNNFITPAPQTLENSTQDETLLNF